MYTLNGSGALGMKGGELIHFAFAVFDYDGEERRNLACGSLSLSVIGSRM